MAGTVVYGVRVETGTFYLASSKDQSLKAEVFPLWFPNIFTPIPELQVVPSYLGIWL